MHKKILWITAFTCTLMLNQTAFAHSSECGESIGHMVKSLKINDDQQVKIKPILEQLKSRKKDLGTQLSNLDAQIRQLEASTTIDQAAVDALVDKQAKLIADMMKAKIQTKNQILTILDDQQKTELHNLINKNEEKMLKKYKSCHDED